AEMHIAAKHAGTDEGDLDGFFSHRPS
ncbi:MAG: hypothetical protein RIS79_872, partial [Verrucomicrobiota bacterium]